MTWPIFSTDKLLADWRWLCPQDVRRVAVDAFGDLILEDGLGLVWRLDTSAAQLDRISPSVEEFKQPAESSEKRKEWFFEEVALSLGEQGFRPTKGQCLGYETPTVFKESTGAGTNVYLANLDEYVPFLGDLHEQIKDMPDGGEVRIVVGPKPKKPR
ncbi:MAG TPA: hypothetical protein VNY29_13460 [Terriglobales bacterium]|nr:hypothetical protein [Terriglobales bacterium]